MSRFDCFDAPLNGLKIIQRKAIEDERGFLSRVFCAEAFAQYGFEKAVNQINQTLTRQKGAVRGLHYQLPPHAEIKLVSCIRGEVLDIAVDLRKDSLTFLHWHAEILNESNRRSLLIPEGFAHGFQTLTNNCEMLYLHSAPYVKESESAINIADPKLAITLPLAITDISERDKSHPMINHHFEGIVV
jgi:dTDP-4-dehydrorhamnose 3,5-epimerase